MSKRLQILESMIASGSADPFVFYGLAMEYKNLSRPDDAIRTFERLRNLDPEYLPMYLMAGQTASAASRTEEAVDWLSQGRELAVQKKDPKALGELEALLQELGALPGG